MSTLVCYATQPGGVTLDGGDHPGNPFATALLDIAASQNKAMRAWPAALEKSTFRESRGRQLVEVSGRVGTPTWRFEPADRARSDRRVCLLLMVGDYSRAGLRSLPGVAVDERRLRRAFKAAGFRVVRNTETGRAHLLDRLERFAEASAASDIAIIYSTGHGVHARGRTYLLPGDASGTLDDRSARGEGISVVQIARAARSPVQNVVFFAGCRTRL